MSSEIENKRTELKNEIASREKKTIVDALLYRIGRGRSIPTWTGILLIFFLTLLISVILGLISGGISAIFKSFESLPGGSLLWVLWIIFNLFTCTALMVLGNVFIHRMFDLFRDQIIDQAANMETLDRINNWVKVACKKGPVAVITILLGGLLEAVLLVNILQKFVGSISGFRPAMFLWLFISQSIVFLMFLVLTLALSLQIKNFDLVLFEANPAGSETIAKLSEWFRDIVYLLAIYGALQTFGLIKVGLLSYFLAMMLSFWTPIVVIFITSHMGFSHIIQRNKWKTLNSVQQKISAIQMGKTTLPKEDRDYLNWLLDYHERVKATQNSAIDIKSGISFLNSLLLPVIAFILGNIDTIISLISRSP